MSCSIINERRNQHVFRNAGASAISQCAPCFCNAAARDSGTRAANEGVRMICKRFHARAHARVTQRCARPVAILLETAFAVILGSVTRALELRVCPTSQELIVGPSSSTRPSRRKGPHRQEHSTCLEAERVRIPHAPLPEKGARMNHVRLYPSTRQRSADRIVAASNSATIRLERHLRQDDAI